VIAAILRLTGGANGREVWFIPDSDYFDNDDVMKAAVRLDKKLTERGAKFYTAPRGASPK
jgi:hypothetical protein